ncbi:MAG: hypothetical protein JNJ78_07265 [Anaerolineae bacterium]|nr:hypothetical protein [Anaerolineae bacterium]
MFLAYPDRNLILTGYTGAQQLTVGQQIAERLHLRYVNVDSLLESRAGLDLDEIRLRYGETRLKMLEMEAMQEVQLYRGALIRMSGQTLLRTEYTKRLQQTGLIVCMVVTLDAVLRRLHLSMGGRYHNPQERALAIGHLKREWAIRKLEGVCELDLTDQNEAQMVERVCAFWEAMSGGTAVDLTNGTRKAPRLV